MCEYSLCSVDEMEWVEGEVGERYRLQAMVYRHYNDQE
jgi:hypothetical protein